MALQRDIYVDVAKGMAMLMVVRIHTEGFTATPVPYPIIAVPFFFFLSGFYDNTDKPLKAWFFKTSRSLLMTGVIWMLISYAYLSLLHVVKDGTLPNISFNLEHPQMVGVMWFLFALFYAKCGMAILHKLRMPFYVGMPMSLLLAVAVSRVNLPLLLSEGLAALPFYYLGRQIYPYLNKNIEGGGVLMLVGLAGVVCLFLMLHPWFPMLLVPWGSRSVLLYPVCFMMTVLSFFPFLWMANKLKSQQWLANYGKQTLGILVIHPLILHTCAIGINRVFEPSSSVWIIAYLFAYVVACVASFYLSLLILRFCPMLLGRYKTSSCGFVR